MLMPIVLRIRFQAVIPLAPFFVGEFVDYVPLTIENIRVFAEEKIANSFQNAHVSIYASFHCRRKEKKLQSSFI
jgi:hypothetical protein